MLHWTCLREDLNMEQVKAFKSGIYRLCLIVERKRTENHRRDTRHVLVQHIPYDGDVEKNKRLPSIHPHTLREGENLINTISIQLGFSLGKSERGDLLFH
jgi:hypothetical protein